MEVINTNGRIKKLRKALDLTQQEFADKLGIKRNTVATYESGKSKPSDAAVVLLCKTFNVNEEWLRTGEGDMFNATSEALLDRLAQDYGLDEVGYRIMSAYLKLDERDRLAVGQLIQNLIDAPNQAAVIQFPAAAPAIRPPWAETPAPTAAEPDAHALYEAEARAKAEEYYRELMQEREQTEPPSASPTVGASGDLLA